MTDWAVVGTVAVTFLGTVGIWIKAYYDYRQKKAGNNPHPCGAHSVAIGKIETEIKNIKEDIKEIKEKLI